MLEIKSEAQLDAEIKQDIQKYRDEKSILKKYRIKIKMLGKYAEHGYDIISAPSGIAKYCSRVEIEPTIIPAGKLRFCKYIDKSMRKGAFKMWVIAEPAINTVLIIYKPIENF